MSLYRPSPDQMRLLAEHSPVLARLIIHVACSSEQRVKLEALTDQHSLTRGALYEIGFWEDTGGLYYTDNQHVPVPLKRDSDLEERFALPEGLTHSSGTELTFHPSASQLWYAPTIRENILTANRLATDPTRFQVGDILKNKHDSSQAGMGTETIYVVARLLTSSESRTASLMVHSMARMDLVCLRVEGGEDFQLMAASSWQFVKIGSLKEWDLPELDPAVVGKMTIFG